MELVEPAAPQRLRLHSNVKMGRLTLMKRHRPSLMFVSTVWLTTASLALASSPRVDCVCPNGRTKAYCLGDLFGLEACCSSQHCNEPPSNSSTRSCCRRKASAKKTRAATPVQCSIPAGARIIQQKGCAKIFVAPTIAAAETPQCYDSEKCGSVSQIDAIDCDAAPGNVLGHGFCRQVHFPTTRPPTHSRSILLQRFLI